MKTSIYLFLLVLIISCNNSNSPNFNELDKNNNIIKSIKLKNSNNILALSKPRWHFCKMTRDCNLAGRTCFDEVVVEVPKIPYILELNNLINNNLPTNTYFQENGKYLAIFPELTGVPLDDLRSGLTTLRFFMPSDSEYVYHIIYTNDTNQTPEDDYNQIINW